MAGIVKPISAISAVSEFQQREVMDSLTLNVGVEMKTHYLSAL